MFETALVAKRKMQKNARDNFDKKVCELMHSRLSV